jgi:hypothetical protein
VKRLYQFVRALATRAADSDPLDLLPEPARPARPPPRVRRLDGNPIISPALFSGPGGDNINGPSLIRAPEWLPGRLGRYYLYFAHHHGECIRLAFADRLEGPWHLHAPGTLSLSDIGGDADHVASPDAHVDEAKRRIVLYCHVGRKGKREQHSHVARSADGITFAFDPEPIADFYLRMVPWRDGWVGMSKGGVLYVRDGDAGRLRRLPKPAFPMKDREGNAPGTVRHVALACTGDRLDVYFSRIGDAPERILLAEIDLALPAAALRARNAVEVLRPETTWEGADLPVAASRGGAARAPENALRDPAVFHEDGRTWLVYAVAGESGLAIAELIAPEPAA